MSKLFWNTLKLSPVILSATLLLANRVLAAEATVAELAPFTVDTTSQTATSLESVDAPKIKLESSTTAQQIAQKPVENSVSQPENTQAPAPAQETSSQLSTEAPETLAQVTSVSQLSDVQPTDWAFQALQSLVERYGCIAGYPDGT